MSEIILNAHQKYYLTEIVAFTSSVITIVATEMWTRSILNIYFLTCIVVSGNVMGPNDGDISVSVTNTGVAGDDNSTKLAAEQHIGNRNGNGHVWTSSTEMAGHPNANSKPKNNNNDSTNGEAVTRSDNLDLDERLTLTVAGDQQSGSLKSQGLASAGSDGDLTDGSDTECGLGPCAPRWLQNFASKQAFLVVFCITWVLQGMYYTYFVSVITTIEKLFQIQSKTTGLIMSATEIGQIGSSLLLTYYGGQGHRPKWIAWGMVLFAVSSFTCSLPHFIYGEQLIHANDLLFSGVASTVGSPYGGNSSEVIPPNLCRNPVHNPDNHWLNGTEGQSHNKWQNCEEEYLTEHRIQSKVTTIVLAIFFISLLGVGMGQTAVYTLGIPYIDDNVASRESPLYFGNLSRF